MRFLVQVVSLVMILLLLANQITYGKEEISSRESVFQRLKDAHQSQLKLSEYPRTEDEIRAILDEFHTRDYQDFFIKENVKPIENKFVTYGTDFAFYYIPFFSYSDQTKIVYKENQIYVFEFFPETNDGPVAYKDHYEGILLEKVENRYLVSKYFPNNFPEEIINDFQIKEFIQLKLAYLSVINPVNAPIQYSLYYFSKNKSNGFYKKT